LTILAAFSATIPGCGDDADGDPENGGEAGETGTGGKATTGGRASTEAGSTGEDAGAPSTGGKSGTGGAPSTDAGAPSTDAGAPGEAGSTGTGGSSTGGASSTGGKSGGEGGAPAGECETPQCLIDLVTEECVPEGACVSNIDLSNPTDPTIAICYENGVKAGMELSEDGQSGTFIYQRNGNTCYAIEMPLEESGEVQTAYWYDSDGNLVATTTTDPDTNSQTTTCEDSGESVTYTPGSCGSSEPAPGTAPPDMNACSTMDSTCALD
jgi:YD repeat-containing protein